MKSKILQIIFYLMFIYTFWSIGEVNGISTGGGGPLSGIGGLFGTLPYIIIAISSLIKVYNIWKKNKVNIFTSIILLILIPIYSIYFYSDSSEVIIVGVLYFSIWFFNCLLIAIHFLLKYESKHTFSISCILFGIWVTANIGFWSYNSICHNWWFNGKYESYYITGIKKHEYLRKCNEPGYELEWYENGQLKKEIRYREELIDDKITYYRTSTTYWKNGNMKNNSFDRDTIINYELDLVKINIEIQYRRDGSRASKKVYYPNKFYLYKYRKETGEEYLDTNYYIK